MIKEILLPDLGEGIESADVSEVMIAPGDTLALGEIILVLESEKASMEIPSEKAGKVQKVFVAAGDQIKPGEILIIMDVVSKASEKKDKVKPKQKIRQESDKTTKRTTRPETEKKEFHRKQPFASPGVRKLARELQINLVIVNGTGLKGRVTKNDLHEYIKTQMSKSSEKILAEKTPKIDFSQWGNIEHRPLNKIKQITGERLQRAWQTIPHVTQFEQADISKIDAARKALKMENSEKKIKVTFLPFIIQAAVTALKEFPEFNSSLDHTSKNLIIKKYYHFGIAIDTPAGLKVPVIDNVDKKSLLNLSVELMDISLRARENKLKPKELKGASFTISSLGGIGGTYFTPIINPPEVAILGISRSKWKPTYDPRMKEIIPKYVMPFSLSYDHRVIDGVAAAAFTTRFAEILFDGSTFKK
ncbi:uncharacterized protein METZ01_LOCUS46569 [marine metagenome]|uniref:Dihydrolipoyllysine-residue acetyltransferase component of pyruvate dehydrogenase complex n=1 Tax=marine metagenome TaxID=408172 RepID=A0A381RPA9_9ZZZZ|tara:strand:+ start:341 stop:1591 length:1251 start_codon:yes stop_codon:yes gene_type:complete